MWVFRTHASFLREVLTLTSDSSQSVCRTLVQGPPWRYFIRRLVWRHGEVAFGNLRELRLMLMGVMVHHA